MKALQYVIVAVVSLLSLWGFMLNVAEMTKTNELVISQNEAKVAQAQADQAQADAMRAQAEAAKADAYADIAEVGDDMLAIGFLGTSNVILIVGGLALAGFYLWSRMR